MTVDPDLQRSIDRFGPFILLGLLAIIVLVLAPSTSPDRRSAFANSDFSDIASGRPAQPTQIGPAGPPDVGAPGTFDPVARTTAFPSSASASDVAELPTPPNGEALSPTAGTEKASPVPLRIAFAAWATATPGSPSDSVPENGLPVGAALGSDTKRTFVRFAGHGSSITLKVNPDSRSTYVASAGGITACPITTADWSLRSGAAFSEAPSFDRNRCVDGSLKSDGTSWTFDLSQFGDVENGNGIALVPRAGTPTPPYQITLTRE